MLQDLPSYPTFNLEQNLLEDFDCHIDTCCPTPRTNLRAQLGEVIKVCEETGLSHWQAIIDNRENTPRLNFGQPLFLLLGVRVVTAETRTRTRIAASWGPDSFHNALRDFSAFSLAC